ncbi:MULTISPECIES: peptide chain release factor 3 [Aeromicrobium]|uniref:peptide chain release factor 3 n=1 Tax=Aeromicrobium TaxID=2040 RepID=UPI0007013123|nr:MULTISPECIES: peptide chain release factor 3 [Aeromicrobium]KQX76215.1 peptide chain release factor 3 [Aeromicrobium sp. Root472D3]MBD8608119.1 peptide chain release factor 3 [Aeromicrobium sp. CFBP 8757]MCL8252343.1 peptide chain release factor 3 [Aeromicrobium fastidiosum]
MSDNRPRRTFAVISHPDAGKSTLTEALALHARVITEAGAVHGKGDRRATVSDWMAMEKARGISITSAALQFVYRDHVVNLVDTPGHSDFSEDTYRVLSAVDSAVMLVDAGKGLEPQTLKLFRVCALRGIPVITVINKWDRPGLSPLGLMDEIERQIKLRPTPLTWPVGEAGDFRGVLDRRTGEFVKYTRTAGGATRAPERRMASSEVEDVDAQAWSDAVDEHELLSLDAADHDQERFLAGETTPVMFASALQNFGVAQLLDLLLDLAPAPSATEGVDGSVRQVDDPFSAFVFKVQSGMNSSHRDRMAYARVVSGTFERGMVVTHASTGRPFATKYAQSLFGRETSSVEQASPGDIIGFVNAQALRVGDTVYDGEPIDFPPVPSFAPEHFMAVSARDIGRYKQFRRGIEQLDQEGVVQVLRSDLRGDQSPVLAAVGPLQFEVVEERMTHEFTSPIRLTRLDYSVARLTDADGARTLSGFRGAEVLQRTDGTYLALFIDKWRANNAAREFPDVLLDELPAGGS